MGFKEFYDAEVRANYPDWQLDKAGRGLDELAYVIDSSVPEMIRAQEQSLSFIGLIDQALAQTIDLKRGVITAQFIGHLKTGLTNELNTGWITPWVAQKAAALAMIPPPPSIVFIGTPPNGSIVSTYIKSFSGIYSDNINVLANALKKYMTTLYPQYLITGPPPYPYL